MVRNPADIGGFVDVSSGQGQTWREQDVKTAVNAEQEGDGGKRRGTKPKQADEGKEGANALLVEEEDGGAIGFLEKAANEEKVEGVEREEEGDFLVEGEEGAAGVLGEQFGEADDFEEVLDGSKGRRREYMISGCVEQGLVIVEILQGVHHLETWFTGISRN